MESVKRTLALCALAVLQGEMEILAWSYGKTSPSVQLGRRGTFVRLHCRWNLGSSIGLHFKEWYSVLLWKLGTKIHDEGWTLANEYVIALDALLLLSENVTFSVIFLT